MGSKRIVLKSDQEPSIVAFCDAVKNGWHGEIVPKAFPKGESKSNGEVDERAVQSVHGLARTLKDFLWSRNLELRWSPEVRCWLGWSSIVPTFSYFSTRVSRTTVTLPDPGELIELQQLSALSWTRLLHTSFNP